MHLQDISCPICQSQISVKMGNNPDFQEAYILMCGSCGFMRTYPTPKKSALAELYRSDYRKQTNETPNKQYLMRMDARANSQKSFILKHSPTTFVPSKILDIGCGAGSLLLVFADDAEKVTGFEPDINMMEFACSRLSSSSLLFNETFSPRKSNNICNYTLIMASHVLEHVPDPCSFISNIFSILDEEGLLFLEVPSETEDTVRDVIKYKHKGRMHLLFFNPETIRGAIEAAGGEVIFMSTFGQDINSFSVVTPQERYRKNPMLYLVQKSLMPIIQYLNIESLKFKCGFSEYEYFNRETPKSGIVIRVLAKKCSKEIFVGNR